MRTLAQIYNEIVAEKDNQAAIQDLAPASDSATQLLSALNSDSKVAIWRLWAYVVAAAIYTHEALFEIFRKEVQQVADAGHTGTRRWYRDAVLRYQHGDLLVYDSNTGRYGYDPVDVSARIVTQCAVVEGNNGVVIFKVAKEGSGSLEGLDTPEKEGLEGYIRQIRWAGTRFTVVTGDGDIIKIEASIYYEAVATLATVKDAVEAAIQGYVEGLPFNGEFLNSKLVDAIQAVPGVNDVVLDSVQVKKEPLDSYITIPRIYIPEYGYLRFDDAPGNTLDDTINYVAQ